MTTFACRTLDSVAPKSPNKQLWNKPLRVSQSTHVRGEIREYLLHYVMQ